MGFMKQIWMERSALGYSHVPDKYVCPECFRDDAIRSFIKAHAVKQSCDYCGKKSEVPIAAPFEEVLVFILEGIMTEWDDPTNWVGWEDGSAGARVIDSDDLFRYEVDLEDTNEQVLDDIVSTMSDRKWCQRDPYGLREEEALTLSWESFAEQVKHHTRYVFFRLDDAHEEFPDTEEIPAPRMLDRISEEISKVESEIRLTRALSVGQKLFRVRIHDRNKVLRTAKEMGTVPLEKAIYSNRMSPAGIPMFYGAFDPETALKETIDPGRVAPWKVASVATFRVHTRMTVLDLSRMPEIPSLYDPQKRHLRSSLVFLHGFVDELSRPISKDTIERIEYVPTQVFTEYIRHLYRDDEGGSLKGILYPSSKNTGGVSCVLFIENKHCCDQYQDETGVSANDTTPPVTQYLVLDREVERREVCGRLEYIKTMTSFRRLYHLLTQS